MSEDLNPASQEAPESPAQEAQEAKPKTPKSMPLAIFGGVSIFGGPYVDKPEGFTGVKMAVEIDRPCDIAIDTRDYSVPTQEAMQSGILQAIERLSRGETLYAGCWGGIGRTGLFMACLAKASGVGQPIPWVRGNYNEHAVETKQQAAFVDAFDPRPGFEKIKALGGFGAESENNGAKPRRRLFGRG